MNGTFRWSLQHRGGNEKTFGGAQNELQKHVDFDLKKARRLQVGPATYFFPEDCPEEKIPSKEACTPETYFEEYPKIRALT
ncbi:MAG: hypothetical protein HGA67_02390 [Candidatus Yonathbacteria bacterium]|nr:hypothetical protein [Candidatus Yonathbacteria bacterium]